MKCGRIASCLEEGVAAQLVTAYLSTQASVHTATAKANSSERSAGQSLVESVESAAKLAAKSAAKLAAKSTVKSTKLAVLIVELGIDEDLISRDGVPHDRAAERDSPEALSVLNELAHTDGTSHQILKGDSADDARVHGDAGTDNGAVADETVGLLVAQGVASEHGAERTQGRKRAVGASESSSQSSSQSSSHTWESSADSWESSADSWESSTDSWEASADSWESSTNSSTNSSQSEVAAGVKNAA